MSTSELLWVLIRAFGLVALIASTASVVLGVLATRSPAPGTASTPAALDRRVLRQYAHRSAGLVAVGAITLHIVLVVIDTYVSVPLIAVLVPFTSSYERWAVGLGTIATYGFALAVLSGLARGRFARRSSSANRWRLIHITSYLTWLAAVGHGVFAGSDSGRWWGLAITGACILSVAAAAIVRGSGADHYDRSALPAARRALVMGETR